MFRITAGWRNGTLVKTHRAERDARLYGRLPVRPVREVARRLRSLAARFDAIRWPAPARTVWSLADRVAFFSLMCEVERADVRSPVDGACFASGRALDGTPI